MQRKKWVLFRFVALVVSALWASAAPAQSGVFFEKTVTFTDRADPVVEFTVTGPKLPGTTTVWLEFGSDNSAAPLPLPAGLTFALGKVASGAPAGCGATPLTLTNGLDNDGLWLADKHVFFNDEDATPTTTPRGVFKLDISHADGAPVDGFAIPAAASEIYRICLTGFPAGGMPPARLTAFLLDPQARFSSVTPIGVLAAGGPDVWADVTATPMGGSVRFKAELHTSTGAPLPVGTMVTGIPERCGGAPCTNFGTLTKDATAPVWYTDYTLPINLPCCEAASYSFVVTNGSTQILAKSRAVYLLQGVCGVINCPRPPWRDWVYVVREWPPVPPEPPCFDCPIPWREPPELGFDRVIYTVTPVDPRGGRFGGGRLSELSFNVSNGRIVGDVVDQGNGTYAAMIEYEHGGAEPVVNVQVPGAETHSLAVGQVSVAEANSLRNRSNVGIGALILSLIVNGFLGMRGRGRVGAAPGPQARN